MVTNICNSMIKSNELHVKYLSKFIEAQAEYYENAHKHLSGLLNNSENENTESQNSGGFATLLSGSSPDE